MDKKYLVTKSNLLITSSYDLSSEEQKIILTLASMVQPNDEDFKPYKFSIKDFSTLLGITTKTKYTEIPRITKELMQKVFEITKDDEVLQIAWLSSARYKKGTGIVELEFSPNLKPFLLGLKEFYTSYKLENILELKSKYSIRMYEILKSNEFKKSFEIPLTNLKEILKATTYKTYQHFKSRVILQAHKELPAKTDISFEFEEIKTGRKVTAIKFYIKSKNKQKSNGVEEASATLIKPDPQESGTKNLNEHQELIENISFILTPWKLTEKEVKKILESANWDVDVINEKYKIISSYSEQHTVKNYLKIMLTAIKEDWKLSRDNTSTKDFFNDYEQRSYDFDELEKKLLGWE